MPGVLISDTNMEILRQAPDIPRAENPLHTPRERATSKVELNIMPRGGKSTQIVGRIAIMRSGSSTSGDMDEACFTCPRCKQLILPEYVQADLFSCPSCKLTADSENISEASVFVLTTENLAQLVMRYWLATGGDADIYLKRYKHSMQAAVTSLKEKDWRGYATKRRLAKEQKEVVIYPLKNLMRDNLSGADMGRRFLAFLKS